MNSAAPAPVERVVRRRCTAYRRKPEARLSFQVFNDEEDAYVIRVVCARPRIVPHEFLHLVPDVIVQEHFVAQDLSSISHLIDPDPMNSARQPNRAQTLDERWVEV